MSTTLLILGASGDLTVRYLLPAVAELVAAGTFPPDGKVVGVARDRWTDHDFRRWAGEGLDRHAGAVPLPVRRSLLEQLAFRPADVTDAAALAAVLAPERSSSPLAAYLALPPRLFAPAVEALVTGGLPAGSRIVVEKPFGESLTSARALNETLHRAVPEEAVFRMDHFLGKQTVQNILGLRFANRVFEPVWNARHVERVDIVWDETLALEDRAGYYDHAGALRDMIQNHLLQLLSLVAMEPPATLSEGDLRDRKVEALQAVRRLDAHAVGRDTVRARYGAGVLDGRPQRAYVDEPGIDPARRTETFAALTVRVDNERWAGTPFMLRSGKALARDCHHIDVWFRPVPQLPFGQPAGPSCNRLRLEVNPDRLALRVDINGPGDPFCLEPVELACRLAPQEPSAYARLLVDVFDGNPVLSIRADEAEQSWRIVEPVLDAWRRDDVPLLEYPAGSGGPRHSGRGRSAG